MKRIISLNAILAVLLLCNCGEQKPTAKKQPEDSNTDIALKCSSADATGCQEYQGREYAYKCKNGTITSSLACSADEYCGIDEYYGPFCDFKIPDNAADYCKGRENSSFCLIIGEDTWMLVCNEDGTLYTGSYGTTNCSGYNAICSEHSDEYGTYALCQTE